MLRSSFAKPDLSNGSIRAHKRENNQHDVTEDDSRLILTMLHDLVSTQMTTHSLPLRKEDAQKPSYFSPKPWGSSLKFGGVISFS
jgi:hypothetical protein